MTVRLRYCIYMLLVIIGASTGSAFGAEIYSNGFGGGKWSDPITWRGGKLPTAEDQVVISSGDTVVFDISLSPAEYPFEDQTSPSAQAEEKKPAEKQDKTEQAAEPEVKPLPVTCARLDLDPRSKLEFLAGEGRTVLNVSGPINAFGTIRINAAESLGTCEIWLTAEDERDRQLQISKNGGLLAYGARNLKDDRKNVIVAIPENEKGEIQRGKLLAKESSLDLENVLLQGVLVKAENIDNTGYKANQRLNITDCLFLCQSRVEVSGGDSMVFNRNTVIADRKQFLNGLAVHLYGAPLAQVMHNRIVGYYDSGLGINQSPSAAVIDNTITGCRQGLLMWGADVTIKDAVITDSQTGVICNSMTGVLQNVVVKNATESAFYCWESVPQFSTCSIENLPENSIPLRLYHSSVMMINCNIPPEPVKRESDPRDDKPWVQSYQYLVTGVGGGFAEGTQVIVRTKNLAEGERDGNVRNARSLIFPNGLSAMPKTNQAAIVKSWTLKGDGNIQPAPDYDVSVWEPDGAKVTKTVKPDETWFRADPNAAEATVSVRLHDKKDN